MDEWKDLQESVIINFLREKGYDFLYTADCVYHVLSALCTFYSINNYSYLELYAHMILYVSRERNTYFSSQNEFDTFVIEHPFYKCGAHSDCLKILANFLQTKIEIIQCYCASDISSFTFVPQKCMYDVTLQIWNINGRCYPVIYTKDFDLHSLNKGLSSSKPTVKEVAVMHLRELNTRLNLERRRLNEQRDKLQAELHARRRQEEADRQLAKSLQPME
jgi:hypothetical protein